MSRECDLFIGRVMVCSRGIPGRVWNQRAGVYHGNKADGRPWQSNFPRLATPEERRAFELAEAEHESSHRE
jgi:hypothetical protein